MLSFFWGGVGVFNFNFLFIQKSNMLIIKINLLNLQ